jgi:large subunit ribosomal protein L4
MRTRVTEMAEKAKKTAAPRARKARAAKADGAVPVLSAGNEKVGEVSLLPEVFAAKVNPHLIYEAVKQYRAGGRAGTHMTKNRALVSGTGKKPWRQKGTGRARAGETRNPLWRHGGTVFGPVPRDYSYAMPKKARAAALRSALSQRVEQGALRVVESFPVQLPEKPPFRLTRQLQAILEKLEVAGKTVLVDHKPSDALLLSGRNLPGVRVVADSQLSVYDVLDCKNLLVSRAALGKLTERLSR